MARACYCAVFRTAARKVTAIYDAALEPCGINLAQYSLLRTIQRRAPLSLTELGRVTELDRSTIGRNVKLLRRLGLVRATPGADDQREAVVTLDEQGAQVLERAAPLWDEAQRAVEAKLGADSARQIRTVLQTL